MARFLLCPVLFPETGTARSTMPLFDRVPTYHSPETGRPIPLGVVGLNGTGEVAAMRSFLIVAIGACLSLVTSTAAWFALERGDDLRLWCEVVDHTLVRTNASGTLVNSAVEAVLIADRFVDESAATTLSACQFEQRLDIWFTEPDIYGNDEERVSRLVRRQLNTRGEPLRVTQLQGEGMPTLLFIDSGGDSAASRAFAERVVQELAASGINPI